MTPDFTVVLRGYDRHQVHALLGKATAALADGADSASRASARRALRKADFTVVLRGYDRTEVDGVVQELLRDLDTPADGLRADLGAVLRLSEPTDQQILDEVRRLRSLADTHDL